ncbi:MAG TPA: J domain-containing protein [Candidatus Nanoarchaeia archaeon]|nr:J domain-containing protein [Candidatus Nanoarchaeia archaeon]
MTTVCLKGYEFSLFLAKDSYDRRALQYKNNIIQVLSKIGIPVDDIMLDLEPVAIKNAPASATWYGEGYRMYYSYKLARKYVDNLYVVYKVIELEVRDLLTGKKTFEEFISEFTEEKEVEEMRKEARELLGVEGKEMDLGLIDKKYKELAKKYHPDVEGGNIEMFKKINNAHKILKRELS